MRRCRLGVFLLVSCLALGGCWDERPIEQLSFVTLAAFDGTPGHVQAYLEATVPTSIPGGSGAAGGGGGGGGNGTYVALQGSGPDETAAMQDIQLHSSKSLWFGQIEVVLVSDRLAKSGGMADAMDYFMREGKTRTVAWTYVSPHAEMKRLIRVRPVDVSYPAMAIVDLSLGEKAVTEFNTARVYDVYAALHDTGRDASVPYLTAAEGEFQAGPTALFSGPRLAGLLTGTASRGLPILTNMRGEEAPVTVPCGPKGVLSVAVSVPQTGLGAEVRDGHLEALRVVVRGGVHITQASSCSGNLSTKSAMDRLSDLVGRTLDDELQETVRESQKLDSDPIGFGDYLRATQPTLWAAIRSRWHEVYPRVPVVVTVHVRVAKTGLLKTGEPVEQAMASS